MRKIITILFLIAFAALASAQPTIAPLPDNGPYLNVSSTGTTSFYIFATPTGWPNSTNVITGFYVVTGIPAGCSVNGPSPFNAQSQFLQLTCTNTPVGSYSFGLVAYDNSGLRGTSRYFSIVSS